MSSFDELITLFSKLSNARFSISLFKPRFVDEWPLELIFDAVAGVCNIGVVVLTETVLGIVLELDDISFSACNVGYEWPISWILNLLILFNNSIEPLMDKTLESNRDDNISYTLGAWYILAPII